MNDLYRYQPRNLVFFCYRKSDIPAGQKALAFERLRNRVIGKFFKVVLLRKMA